MVQETAVMDIGSSKITVLVGRRGVNNTICIVGTARVNTPVTRTENGFSPMN